MTCKELKILSRPRPAPVLPSARGCEECLELGQRWVHLRLCMACGHVGCCDDSPNRHATAHHHATKHPVVKSYEPGEDWAWCYVHQEVVDRIPTFPAESPPAHLDPPGPVESPDAFY
jgi:thioredoxin reductase (NADPH)